MCVKTIWRGWWNLWFYNVQVSFSVNRSLMEFFVNWAFSWLEYLNSLPSRQGHQNVLVTEFTFFSVTFHISSIQRYYNWSPSLKSSTSKDKTCLFSSYKCNLFFYTTFALLFVVLFFYPGIFILTKNIILF